MRYLIAALVAVIMITSCTSQVENVANSRLRTVLQSNEWTVEQMVGFETKAGVGVGQVFFEETDGVLSIRIVDSCARSGGARLDWGFDSITLQDEEDNNDGVNFATDSIGCPFPDDLLDFLVRDGLPIEVATSENDTVVTLVGDRFELRLMQVAG